MIFHIVLGAEWERARRDGSYAPPSIAIEGFIHCSTREQIIGTANRFYRGRNNLVLLVIDETRLAAPVRYETPLSGGDARQAMCFPHIYGPLNLDAVREAVPFPCDAGGEFQLPPNLHEI